MIATSAVRDCDAIRADLFRRRLHDDSGCSACPVDRSVPQSGYICGFWISKVDQRHGTTAQFVL